MCRCVCQVYYKRKKARQQCDIRCVCQVYYKRKKARQQCDKASSDVSLCMSGVLQA